MTRLILASASPRRRELLARCGFDFTVAPVPAEELTDLADLRLLPEENARRKADAAADAHPGALVVGADTLVLCDGRALGKPADLSDAARMLRELAGRTHEVVTGVALRCRARELAESWSVVSEVVFKPLSDADIADYLRLVPVLDKAGAYAIQDHGEMLVARFTGELENIIGLPLERLRKRLCELIG